MLPDTGATCLSINETFLSPERRFAVRDSRNPLNSWSQIGVSPISLKKQYAMMGMRPEALIIKLNQAITPAQQAEYLAPGATDEQIQSFREALGPISERLPDSFYAFYRWHNGSKVVRRYDEVPFHENKPLLSLDGIARSFQTWKELAQEGHFSHYVDGAWWDPAWVPYIETEWYVQVIDTRGSFGGQPGQILGFDYKSADDRFIFCSSFDYWLAWMLKLIEVDLWRPGELSDEEESPKNKRYLTSGEEQRASNMMHTLNPGHPWVAELHRYRKAAAENLPNPHWGELEETIKRDDLANLQRLIEEKRIGMSEQNPHQVENRTPLHLAGKYHAWQSARWLVKQGADLSIKDAYGWTPLGCLINSLDSNFGTNQSHLTHTEEQGQQIITIFDAVTERAEAIDLIYLARCSIEVRSSTLLGYALEHGCDPNAIPRFFNHPLLHEALKQGWLAGYEQLLRAGADSSDLHQDGVGVTPYIENHLDERLSHLVRYQYHRDRRKIIGLADFFRAEGRLADFLAHVQRHAEALFKLPPHDKQRDRGLSALTEVLQAIDPNLAETVVVRHMVQ